MGEDAALRLRALLRLEPGPLGTRQKKLPENGPVGGVARAAAGQEFEGKKRGRRQAAPYRGASALQPGEIRGSLGGFRRGGEDRPLVFLHDRQPMSEILRVIGARFVGDLKIGTEEGGAQLGDKLLHRIGLIAKAFSKLAVAAGLGRSPVTLMPISA